MSTYRLAGPAGDYSAASSRDGTTDVLLLPTAMCE